MKTLVNQTTVLDPNCPLARTAAVIGGKWTPLILRDLFMRNTCRFQDLFTSLKTIPPNTLSERLKMLESNGIIQRRIYEQHPPRAVYLLTDRGRALGPVLQAMRDWGNLTGE